MQTSAPGTTRGRSLRKPVGWMGALLVRMPELPHMRGAFSQEHLRELTPDRRCFRDPEDTGKDELAPAERTWAWEELGVQGLLQLPNLLLLNPRSQLGLKAAGALCSHPAVSRVRLKAQAAEQVGTATKWSSAVLPHALKHTRKQRGLKIM